MKLSAGRFLLFSTVFLFTAAILYMGFTFYKLKNSQVYFDTLGEGFENPEHVEILILRNQNLTALPQSIGQFTNLRVLNLANNQLKTLPDEIGKLQALEELILENNQIRDLPPSIL